MMYLPNTTIRIRFSLVCGLGLLGLQSFADATVGAAWGSAVNGLALAVEARSASDDGKLHVLFRNTGTGYMRFAVGGRSGNGAMYSIQFLAASPDGRTCKVDDLTVGVVGGYVGPIVISLAPGAVDQISIELRNLRCMDDHDVPLDQLLKEGYSVRATLTVSSESNRWAKVPNGWTGTVSSGSFVM